MGLAREMGFGSGEQRGGRRIMEEDEGTWRSNLWPVKFLNLL